MRGGGHFSGRLTAPICVAGGIALQILKRRGVIVGAHLASVGDVKDTSFPLLPKSELLAELAQKRIPVLDDQAGERMEQSVTLAASRNDSLGGSVECVACGLPAGLGEPMFDGVENRLAQALFGIPAVKGLEFGNGFECINMHGSENNDEFSIGPDGSVVTRTNHCGGILGGITDGMPVSFRVALKPTPSIGKPQRTVNLKTMAEADMTIAGRHDPCVALRAVPAVEAVTGLVLLDLLLEETKYGLE